MPTMPELAMSPWVSVPTPAEKRGTVECMPGEKEWDNKRGSNTENPKTKCPSEVHGGDCGKPLCVTTGQVTKIYSEFF